MKASDLNVNFNRFEGKILEKLNNQEFIMVINDQDNTMIKIKVIENDNDLIEGQNISVMGQARNRNRADKSTEAKTVTDTYFEVSANIK